MIDPNRDVSDEVLKRLYEASYEEYKLILLQSIKQLLTDFEMTWADLAEQIEKIDGRSFHLALSSVRGRKVKGERLMRRIGTNDLKESEINAIAAAFSCEPYLIFRPRAPWAT